MEVCTSNTPSPQVQPMEVCVRALRFRSLLVRLALDSLLHTLLTFIECMLIQSIRCQKNRPCVCVCVCVCGSLSLSLSLFLPQMEVCVHPHPRPRSSPPFPFPFPFFSPIPLSLSLSLCRTTTCLLPYFYLFLSSYFHLRPQNRESTVSRPICEVKHGID